MRVRCKLASPDVELSRVELRDDAGVLRGELWRARIPLPARAATSAEAAPCLVVLATKPCVLPEPAVREPATGILARVLAALREERAVALLHAPHAVFGRERILFAEGVRLLGLTSADDEACWDELLRRGLPVWGVRGTVVLDVDAHGQAAPAAIASAAIGALLYGRFHCEDGLVLIDLRESPQGVAWTAADPAAEATVVVRDGFEAQRLPAAASYADRGDEGSVRIVLRSARGSAFTQPRLIAPRRQAAVVTPLR